jgi:hypothetical protein
MADREAGSEQLEVQYHGIASPLFMVLNHNRSVLHVKRRTPEVPVCFLNDQNQ